MVGEKNLKEFQIFVKKSNLGLPLGKTYIFGKAETILMN